MEDKLNGAPESPEQKIAKIDTEIARLEALNEQEGKEATAAAERTQKAFEGTGLSPDISRFPTGSSESKGKRIEQINKLKAEREKLI